MAITFIEGVESKNGASATTLTATITATTAGDLIYAHVLSFEATNPQVPTGVTLGGVAMTKYTGSDQVVTGALLGVCTAIYWKKATGGETSVVASWTLAQGFRELHVLNVRGFTTPIEDGAMQTNGPASSKAGVGVSTITGSPFTPTAQPGVIIAFVGVGASISPAGAGGVGGGFSHGSGTGDRASYLLTSSLAQQTPQWTDSATDDDYITDTVGFRETGGGSAAVVAPSSLAIMGVQ